MSHVQSIRNFGERIKASVQLDPTREIPDCPGWSARRLLGHMGSVYAMMSNLVSSGATEFVAPRPDQKAPSDDSIDQWFDARLDEVITVLSSRDPSEEQWSWTSDRTVGFFHRRLVFESAVHLADLQRADGVPPAIDRDVAVAGIDEFFDLMLPASSKPRPHGSLHLHCTDGPGEWLVRVEGDSIVTTREHVKGDAAWRGQAVDLFLFSWGRRSPRVDVIGDSAVSQAWASCAP